MHNIYMIKIYNGIFVIYILFCEIIQTVIEIIIRTYAIINLEQIINGTYVSFLQLVDDFIQTNKLLMNVCV